MNIAVNNKFTSGYKVSIFYLILLGIIVSAGWFTTRYLGDKARQEILQFNQSTVLTLSSHFTGEFEHIERSVRVLSGSPLIAPALIFRKDEDIANANSALDRYNSGLDSSVTYLMDSNGMTIASSNRNDPDSFVGKSYQFRPYFIQAMKGDLGRYFAVGVTSLKRGFYASYPVKNVEGRIIGVVVSKKDIDEKEADLSRYPYFFLVDPNGIIFLSSRKDMTLKSLWPISRENRLSLHESGQFGEIGFEAFLPREIADDMEINFHGRGYIASRRVINTEGWSVIIMTSTEKIFLYKFAGVFLSMWIFTLIAIPMIIHYRTFRSAEMLRESEAKYRRIVETANEGICTTDENDIITYVNQRMADMLGHLPEEIIGKPFVYSIFPEDLAGHAERWSHRIQGLSETYERRFRRSDGGECWASVSATPISAKDGRFMGSFAMLTDITERKRAEIELRMSEKRFSRFFSSSPVGTSILSMRDIKFVEVNDVFLKLFGYAREEIIGKNPLDLGIWTNPEDRVKVVEILQREGRVKDFETRFRWKSGEIGDVLFSGEVIEVAGQQYLLGLTHDITERKRTEEERRRLEDRLQRAEKMEALGTLAGGVAHDLNNVLGAVVGYSELLLYDSSESSSAKSKATEILKSGLRAAAIVQDLLTLARRGVSNREVLNLNHIVLESQNSPEFAGISSYHPNIRLKTDLEESLLNVSGSAVHLSKSLMNLVSNAAEAMPQGGLITIKTWNQYLDRPVSGYDEVREGDYVVLCVSDTGEGIPASDMKRIFEPFYTKKVMGRSGTGLGLAVVWGTVKDQQGYINVESQEGKGTVFTLYFPVTREEITSEQVRTSAAEYVGNGESILIVDDVKEQREMACAMLKKLNYTVCSVSGGEEAVEYLKENAVDLVVLDMIMDPGMDGLDTYAKILETYPHQRAIIVSGFSETKRVSRSQALGVGAYVKKPYVLEKLGLAVRKELDRLA